MQGRNSDGTFGSGFDSRELRNRLELQRKLREVFSATPGSKLPNRDFLWAGDVAREWPEWARGILLEFGFDEGGTL